MSSRHLPSTSFAALFLGASAYLGVACGGGDTSGSGGSTTTSTTSTPCPDATPNPGDPCDLPDGTMCHWDYVCGTPTSMGTCNGGKWDIALAEAVPYECPATAPKDGDECCNLGGLSCVYGTCDAASGMGSGFTCVDNVWKAATVGCIQCGDVPCNAGSLCLRHEQGVGATTYQCITNCGTAVTCDCASAACAANEACSVDATTVVCSCTNC